MNRKGLLWHIFLPFLTVILLSLALITGYTSRALRGLFFDQTAEDLADRAHLLEDQFAPLLRDENAERIQDLCRRAGAASRMRLTVVAPNGTVLGDTMERPANMDNHGDRPEIVAARETGHGRSMRYSATLGHRRMYVAVALRDGDTLLGYLRTSQSLKNIDSALKVLQREVAVGGLILACLAGLVSYGLAHRISVPLRELKSGAERLAGGQLDVRLITAADSEEIGSLAETFNSMARQLSDRIRTIENQRNELEAMLASMVEGVVAIDRDEIVISWNEASSRLLGIRGEKAVGHSIQEIVRNPDLITLAKVALAGQEPSESDIVVLRETERYLQVHATGLQGGDGQSLGALLVLNDVTRLRRLENLRRDFVANVSHELRTPITSIKGFVETLRESPPQDAQETDRFLAIIDRQAGRLQAIIDDLLALSRLEQETGPDALACQLTAMRPLLGEAVNQCTARAGADAPGVEIECPHGLSASVNPPLLEQAVVNLVDNALKYSGTTAPIQVICRREGSSVVIEVVDEGRGIPAEHLPRLFERFYRVDRARSRKLGGTGLGLAIAKHIVQAHRGEIHVTSEVGLGSRFTMVLPLEPASSA